MPSHLWIEANFLVIIQVCCLALVQNGNQKNWSSYRKLPNLVDLKVANSRKDFRFRIRSLWSELARCRAELSPPSSVRSPCWSLWSCASPFSGPGCQLFLPARVRPTTTSSKISCQATILSGSRPSSTSIFATEYRRPQPPGPLQCPLIQVGAWPYSPIVCLSLLEWLSHRFPRIPYNQFYLWLWAFLEIAL